MKPRIRHHKDSADLSEALERLLRDEFARTRTQDCAIVLSGGNTPLPAYQRLASAPLTASPRLHLLMSDERYVAPDHPDNNAAQFEPARLACRIAAGRFLRVETTHSLEEAAARFDRALATWLAHGMRFSCALLGIGADGHTASLFTRDDLDRAAGHLAIPVRRPTPPDRISVTPLFLRHVERVILLVSGQQKAPMLRALLHAPESIVAGTALREVERLDIWADEAALS